MRVTLSPAAGVQEVRAVCLSPRPQKAKQAYTTVTAPSSAQSRGRKALSTGRRSTKGLGWGAAPGRTSPRRYTRKPTHSSEPTAASCPREKNRVKGVLGS